MKVMLLAAGFGTRMKALTRDCPKPLLTIGERSLIEHLLCQLSHAGFTEIVINVSYLAEQIIETLGDGSAYGVSIEYSKEVEPLYWGGGVYQALPLLGDAPFLVISGDLWTDYPFEQLRTRTTETAHFVLVDSPDCPRDFTLSETGKVGKDNPQFTYGGISLIHPRLFKKHTHGRFSFRDVIAPVVNAGAVTGEVFAGTWVNVGTPECLAELREQQSSRE